MVFTRRWTPTRETKLTISTSKYNNARIYDFEGVDDWDHNKRERYQHPPKQLNSNACHS